VQAFYDGATTRPNWAGRQYRRFLARYYKKLIPADASVLEVGCGSGGLLAHLPNRDVTGVDLSSRQIDGARARIPSGHFHIQAGEALALDRTFDCIILSETINQAADVQRLFERLRTVAHRRTRLLVNFHSGLWRPVLSLATFLGLKARQPESNWLSASDVKNLLSLAGWELVKQQARILLPVPFFGLHRAVNRFLAPLFSWFCLTVFQVARPVGQTFLAEAIQARSASDGVVVPPLAPFAGSQTLFRNPLFGKLRFACRKVKTQETEFLENTFPNRVCEREKDAEAALVPSPALPACAASARTVSVIIPARNEAGNIRAAIQRIPPLGRETQIILIEGHSQDSTWEEIQRAVRENPHRDLLAMRQTGKGKGNAVREAIAAAKHEILMILDADLTVPPEELTKFYDALASGKTEFANGVRLVYPMEKKAMRFLNMCANKFFGIAFSWTLGQPIKDTLCGTKAIFKEDYQRIAANRSHFGDFDPFGDFDLLFGADKLLLKITDIPIRYRERTYGTTNISRWLHGWLLLQMLFLAAKKLKFI
jgi:SAM-dependent methyltransferase